MGRQIKISCPWAKQSRRPPGLLFPWLHLLMGLLQVSFGRGIMRVGSQPRKEQGGSLGLHSFGSKQERMCLAVCCCVCSWCQLHFWPRDPQLDRIKPSRMHQGEQAQYLFFLQRPSVSSPSRASQNILNQEAFHWKMLFVLKSSRNLLKCQWQFLVWKKSKHYSLIVQLQFVTFWLSYHNTILFY